MKMDPSRSGSSISALTLALVALSTITAVAIAAGSVTLPGTAHRQAEVASGRDRYVETLPGLRTGAVSERQRLLNSAILNEHLSKGEHLRLRAGTRIEIGSTIRIGSGGAIIGDSGPERPTFYLPASAFNNRNDPAGRYGRNAVGIDFSGELGGTFRASAGVRIENVRLLSEQAQGRWLHAIVGRNVTNCLLRNVELSGFPTTIGIALASARGCRVTGAYIHDFSDSTAWRALPQSTGIEIDNDLVHGIPSADNVIDHFRIDSLRVGGRLLAKWGYQTDGINILGSAIRTKISSGEISDVGEGIDTFGADGTIERVRIMDAYIFGLKFIHGATGNRVNDVTITNAGLAGVIFSGSDQASHDTAGNIVTRIEIRNIDPAGHWKAHSTAGIMVSGRNSRRVPTRNQIVGAQIDLGPNGKYGWLDQSTGSANRGTDIQIQAGPSLDRPVLILYGGGSVERP